MQARYIEGLSHVDWDWQSSVFGSVHAEMSSPHAAGVLEWGIKAEWGDILHLVLWFCNWMTFAAFTKAFSGKHHPRHIGGYDLAFQGMSEIFLLMMEISFSDKMPRTICQPWSLWKGCPLSYTQTCNMNFVLEGSVCFTTAQNENNSW